VPLTAIFCFLRELNNPLKDFLTRQLSSKSPQSLPVMENTLTNLWHSITGTSTDCDKVVQILDLIVDGEADSDDQHYFYKHVEECAPCFGVYNKEQKLRAFLKESVKRKTVPAHLSNNIKSLIQELSQTESVEASVESPF
jgi:anti-sigma factor (TIGR02949 family)